MLIIIGHSSYSGSNAQKVCFSTAEAVIELAARDITSVDLSTNGKKHLYKTIQSPSGPVEVQVYRNFTAPYGTSYNQWRKTYRAA